MQDFGHRSFVVLELTVEGATEKLCRLKFVEDTSYSLSSLKVYRGLF